MSLKLAPIRGITVSRLQSHIAKVNRRGYSAKSVVIDEWEQACIDNEYTEFTEPKESWVGLSWFDRFQIANKRREDFPSFVHQTMTEKGFDLETIYNPPLSMEKINDFESKYDCKLPKDYVLFLNKIGNGGAAWAYGCPGIMNNQTYENGNHCCEWNEWERYQHLKYRYPYINDVFQAGYEKIIDPEAAANSPFEGPLNPGTEWTEYTHEEYVKNVQTATDPEFIGFQEKMIMDHKQGTIAVGLDGCCYETFLVVNGKDRGFLYDNLEAIDKGYMKAKPFLSWYENFVRSVGTVDEEMTQICLPHWLKLVKSSKSSNKN